MSSKRIALFIALLGVMLLIGGAAVLLVANQPASPTPTPDVFVSRPDGVNPEIERVTIAGAKAAFDEGSAVFVDARPLEYYEQGHIPKAVNMPDESIPAELVNLPKDTWIITYCT
jgi:3-mercaptopyruvate sulfurtransferase SseA